jgi:molecular chaperone GrpE
MNKPKATTKPNKEQAKVDELMADLQRVHADFVNFKRRAEDDRLRSTRFGRESAIIALLPVVDSFERSFAHIPKDKADSEWVIGVRAVARQLVDALKGLGVERIVAVGKPFDPNLHEAVHAEGNGKHEIVAEELQAGYAMDGEVIRHAIVKVKRK